MGLSAIKQETRLALQARMGEPCTYTDENGIVPNVDHIAAGLIALASGGDDYELVLAAEQPIAGTTVIGRFEAGEGLQTRLEGKVLNLDRLGYRHGG